MPQDWAFDQISTVTTGTGSGQIQVDNNILSGRDTGQNDFAPVPTAENQDVGFVSSQSPALLADLQQYLESQGIPETGGSWAEGEVQVYSTTDAFAAIIQYDSLLTGLARALKMRKALIAVPIFWEVRKRTTLDSFADDGVMRYYAGTDIDPTNQWIKRDSSTGLGQIFAVTAIVARNYVIQQGIITGELKD